MLTLSLLRSSFLSLLSLPEPTIIPPRPRINTSSNSDLLPVSNSSWQDSNHHFQGLVMVRQQRTHGPRALEKVSTMATIGTLEKSSFTSYTSGRLPGTTQLCYKRCSSQQPWRANFLGVFQEQIKSVFQILFPKRRLQ